MKTILLATASTFALAVSAIAADLPARPITKAPVAVPVPVDTWSGFYLGIQGGVVSQHGSFSETSASCCVANGSKTETGGTFGANAGYNLQQGAVVYGLEADWSWVGAKAATSWAGTGTNNGSFDVTWLATVRGRLGVVHDLTLFYVTGGVAFGQVKNSVVNSVIPADFLRESKVRTGWTAGAGVERKIAPNWTLRGEARYVDLGRSETVCGAEFGCTTGYSGRFKNTLVQGTVGVDLKF